MGTSTGETVVEGLLLLTHWPEGTGVRFVWQEGLGFHQLLEGLRQSWSCEKLV